MLSLVLAFSAWFELIEWLVGENTEAFLGTQGYMWDTQSDMGYALFGEIIALLLLSKLDDRQLNKILDEDDNEGLFILV